MKLTAAAMLMAMVAVRGEGGGEPVVPVLLVGGPDVCSTLGSQAKALASKMFATAGVRIQWIRRADKNRSGAIVITLTTGAPAEGSAGILAQAWPFEGTNIRIYLSRLRDQAGSRFAPTLLAHVIVHEVTHILQGVDSHSPIGVMKPNWNTADFTNMANNPLSFTPGDLQLLHSGLTNRLALGSKVLMASRK